MPSRYSPAMDPYIERTGIWRDFHLALIGEIRRDLNRRLPKGYMATAEATLRMTAPEDDDERPAKPVPDVTVSGRGKVAGGPADAPGATAVLEPEQVAFPVGPLEETDHYIEVVRLPDREVVTTIEVLSPSNKKSGEPREDYLEKRERTRRAGGHFLEIDLLLAGRRTEPEARMPPRGRGYCGVLSRRELFPDLLIYAWPPEHPLPALPVPLRAPDPDVMIELAPLVDAAYDDGRYEEGLRYDDAPPLSL